MKKELFISFVILAIGILVVSSISAFSFSDSWSGITGRVIEENAVSKHILEQNIGNWEFTGSSDDGTTRCNLIDGKDCLNYEGNYYSNTFGKLTVKVQENPSKILESQFRSFIQKSLSESEDLEELDFEGNNRFFYWKAGDGRKGVVWYSNDKMIVVFSDEFTDQDNFLRSVGQDLIKSYLAKYPSTLKKEKCPQLGYRINGTYCSENGEYLEQLKEESSCENDFECSTNLCIDSKCIGSGFLQRIFAWFKRLFGGSN